MTAVDLSTIKGLRHYNGQGYSDGSDLYTAVTNMLAGSPTVADLITLLSKNNYGGPLTTYRNSRAKSQQRQHVADAIIKAGQLAKKQGKVVLLAKEAELRETIIRATASVSDEQAKAIATEWWSSVLDRDDVEFMVFRTMQQFQYARNGEVLVVDYDSGLSKIVEAGEAVNAGSNTGEVRPLVEAVRDLRGLVKK